MDCKLLFSILSFGLMLLIPIGTAEAAPAHTTANVNLRTGPGTSYGRIGTLGAGARVNVLVCQSSWCRINGSGVTGWVSANYLNHAQVICQDASAS